ncbi:hypothetical protein EW145_g1086 [Phellinidium pouzarii]|uniref:GPI mannosyltransferase 1 n=1 Tax=Phellinidium pouzarii TaxID=167371 RepID=A0A4S4LHM0_9AGAM|nr:hypothetical protein EW145_g1086 [Phellinidium pouzarii]
MDLWLGSDPTGPSLFLSPGFVSFGAEDSGSDTRAFIVQANARGDLPSGIIPLDFVSSNWAAVSPDSLDSLEIFQAHSHQSLWLTIFSLMEAPDMAEDVSEDAIEGQLPALTVTEPFYLRLPDVAFTPREPMSARSRGANKENLSPIFIEDTTTGEIRTRGNNFREWHDKHAVVKYTDIDYRVFTDAAWFLLHPTAAVDGDEQVNIAKGPLGEMLGFGDPYHRETYRYTPLLALIMTPNIFLHPSFGKYLFAACDIVVGILLYKLLLSTVLPNLSASSTNEKLERQATFYAALHLLNPMVFSISTRGSSESTLGVLVIGTLYLAVMPGKTQRTWDVTAVMLGCATHWKVYPLIYGVSLAAVIASDKGNAGKGEDGFGRWAMSLVNVQSIRFAFLSAGTFMILNGIMYLIWGYPFLYETYLYHIHRLDHMHNFSPYWLPIYLTHPDYAHLHPNQPTVLHYFARSPFASFIPQMSLSLGSGLVFGRAGAHNLPFTWFVQTAIFVTLNKVCTSQYFLWYLTILPLVLPSLSFTRAKAASLVAIWVGAQALWLKFAYDLEFLGQNIWEIVLAYQWNKTPRTSTKKG